MQSFSPLEEFQLKVSSAIHPAGATEACANTRRQVISIIYPRPSTRHPQPDVRAGQVIVIDKRISRGRCVNAAGRSGPYGNDVSHNAIIHYRRATENHDSITGNIRSLPRPIDSLYNTIAHDDG